MESTTEKSLPPIKELFSQSWQALVKNILNLLLLNVFAFAIGFVAAVIVILLAVVMGISGGLMSAIQKSAGPEVLSKIPVNTWFLAGGLFLLAMILICVIVTAFSIGQVLVVNDKEGKLGWGQAFRKGFGYIIPLVVVGVLTGFLVWGGLFFFIIPAFFIAVFLSFATYEVILSDKKGVAALRSSSQIISQHFGEIFIRWGLFILLYIVLLIFIPNLVGKIDEATGIIISFYLFFVNVLANWFSMAYFVTLYKQAKAATDETKKISLAWITVIAVLGWLIFGLIAYFALQSGVKAWNSGVLQKSFLQGYQQKNSIRSINRDKILSYAPSACGLSIPVLKTTDIVEGKNRKWMYEELLLDKNVFDILDKDVFPVKQVLYAAVSYKDKPAELVDGKYNLNYPGIRFYCVDNDKGLTLEEYKSLALTNKNIKVTAGKDGLWGELMTTAINLEGNINGKDFKEGGYIGVSKDGSKLMYILYGFVPNDDPMSKILDEDFITILRNLKLRTAPGKIKNMVADVNSASNKQTTSNNNTNNSGSGCVTYNIREGEFASNKCYMKKDYDDLMYYLQRFNSAVSSYNGAIASMKITCSGSEFFKNSCEEDKKEKQQAETDINNYRGIINGIIAKGK